MSKLITIFSLKFNKMEICFYCVRGIQKYYTTQNMILLAKYTKKLCFYCVFCQQNHWVKKTLLRYVQGRKKVGGVGKSEG